MKKILVLILLVLTACTSTKTIGNDSELQGYSEIQRRYKNHRWDEVEKDVGEFRARYPYSKYTADLELMQADSFFQSRNYMAATATYEDFIRRNPNDSKLDFANFRIAESYDRDSSKDIDRDQSNSEQALEKYKDFIKKFPQSTDYIKRAEARIQVLTKRLANHNFFVAQFYWQQNLYAAALSRYLRIINDYSQFPEMVETSRHNGAVCYRKLAKILEKNPKSDKFIYFLDETPQSLRAKAKALENPGKTPNADNVQS